MKTRLLFFLLLLSSLAGIAQEKRPNVLLIITDDQGYGDFGFTGNPHVQTPTIDQLAAESSWFTSYYVSPVCAPTRASLLTGRYSLRTGIRDTYNGGSIIAADEFILAEMLKSASYKTGIFGKWHLGDNYPSRPMDQGFDESLIHLAGGMGQVGDFTTYFQGDSSYFDPILWHNGKQQSYEGYCSDIFAEEAIRFMQVSHSSGSEPFFCYLSFNAPHTPLQVPDEYYQKYKDIDPTLGFSTEMDPSDLMSEQDKEDARKVYAMVDNIDYNMQRVLAALDEMKIAENTLIIFMTDNGPEQYRYLSGLRGRKSSVYQGGVKVPLLLKYPEKYPQPNEISTTAVHMDIFPTLAELCQAELPKDRVIDGHSLVPLLEGKPVEWADRSLFFYWTRKYPELYENMALQKGNYKLVASGNYDADWPDFDLYDIANDRGESDNINSSNPRLAQSMKVSMDSLYQELIQSPNLQNQIPILVGSPNENPSFLSRNDANGQRGIWNQEEVFGKWRLMVLDGTYNLKFKFLKPVPEGGRMLVELGPLVFQQQQEEESDWIEMKGVKLNDMTADLIPTYMGGGRNILPFWVEIERVQP